MSVSTAKKSAWFRERCEGGCQICGTKFPNRNNNGLVFAHILEDEPLVADNVLALCPNCEKSFDNMMKPAIYKALTEFNEGKVPEGWG